MIIDGERRNLKMGSIIDVDTSFQVEPLDGVRVNVIGFVKTELKTKVEFP